MSKCQENNYLEFKDAEKTLILKCPVYCYGVTNLKHISDLGAFAVQVFLSNPLS